MPIEEFEEYQKDKQAQEKKEEFKKVKIRNIKSSSVAHNLKNKKRTMSVMATIYGTGNNKSKNSDLDRDSTMKEVYFKGVSIINAKGRDEGRENVRRICNSKIEHYSNNLNKYKSVAGINSYL